jgi:hypothetical protein
MALGCEKREMECYLLKNDNSWKTSAASNDFKLKKMTCHNKENSNGCFAGKVKYFLM